MSWATHRGVSFGTGDRVRVSWDRFVSLDIGTFSLAGAQPKVSARHYVGEVSGTVRHVRGNHPTEPTRVWIHLAPEGAGTISEGARRFVLLEEKACQKHADREPVFELLGFMEVTKEP